MIRKRRNQREIPTPQLCTSTLESFQKLTPTSLFLSRTVDTQLINYMEVNKDIHFYWLNTEMICILGQPKCTCTNIEKNLSQNETSVFDE